MFRYCPSCASPNIQFQKNRKFFCPDCGFVYYHNTAAATGCIISTGETSVLLVRGTDPARGKLDLPGGFVDPAEGALDGLRRECREELGWDPLDQRSIDLRSVDQRSADLLSVDQGPQSGVPGAKFSLFASFPNIYPYKGVTYNTCDLFFTITAPGLSEKDLRLEADEIAGVRFVRPGDVNFDELAFDSTRRALKAYVDYIQS
jgi:8-oxo-dGTP pyrophosphatase MutT (NUDIX family)